VSSPVERNRTPKRRYQIARGTEAGWEGGEMSEDLVVPRKPGKSPQTTRSREGGSRTLDPLEGKRAGRSSPTTVSTKLQKIAILAKEAPQRVLTTLAHHIDVDFLREAYRRTRKDGAVGVDGQTAAK